VRKTLIEIVQDIMNDMDSDKVNSISDTVESQQIAQTVRTVFESMVTNRTWPHLNRLDTLVSVSDTSTPHYLRLPDDTKELFWIRYDVQDATDTAAKYAEVLYLEPDAFMDVLNARKETESNVTEYAHSSGVLMKIRTDKEPTYWTTFNDDYIVFDSYDSAVDNTLQGAKSQAFLQAMPNWTHEDSAIPDLPEEAFASFMAEAKSTCFALYKEVNQKIEQEAQRQRRWLARKSWAAKGGIRRPDYGRTTYRGTVHRRNPLFEKN
jgi:hypothetical protein